jgi:hypothetical protein
VLRGMTLAQARSACPDLTVLEARPEAYQDTLHALLELLSAITPRLEPADIEHSFLATAGLADRGGQEEQRFSEHLAERVQRALGVEVRVGTAHGKLTSRIVTAYLAQRRVMVLPPGMETSFLGPLSVRYLPLSDDRQAALGALGLRRIQQYAGLPRAGILPRFGWEGLRAHELAHGQDDAQVRSYTQEPLLEAAHVFPEPIANSRSLTYRVEQLAHRLAAPLAERFQMAGEIVLTVGFEHGEPASRRRTLLDPATSAAVLATHARALMAELPWTAPVEKVALGVRGLCPTVGHQLELFRREREQQAGAAAALRRLQARYGGEAVRQGRLLDPDHPLHERRALLVPWEAA